MNESVNSYTTINVLYSAFIKENIESLPSDFYFKNDIQEKESITRMEWNGNFRLSGYSFSSTRGRGSVLRKQSLSRPKNPVKQCYNKIMNVS